MKVRIIRDKEGGINSFASSFKAVETSSEQDVELSQENDLLSSILCDMRKGSITPTTFDSREFTNGFNVEWFHEKYQCSSINVIRFGINHLSNSVIASLCTEGIERIETTIRAESTAKSSGKYNLADAALVPLSDIENMLLNEGCSHLLTADSTNAVLVDIFARVNGGINNGAIKLTENVPEIHTVVLYKNPITTSHLETKDSDEFSHITHQITVIDPSNFLFSSHLSNFIPSIIENDQSSLPPYVIKTIHKSLQIYNPVTKDIGPGATQYRDCVDLAVKIALGLNSIVYPLTLLTYEDIKSCNIIQNLSNNREVDSYITHKLAVRAKQTSNIFAVKIFNGLEKAIVENYDLIEASPLHNFNLTALKKEYVNILSQSKNPQSLLEDLSTHNGQCIDIIQNIHQQAVDLQSDIIGQIANLDMEGMI